MTKSELIRKLARKAGVTDPEAKIFFEVFLQQCAFLLNPGEAVNIRGLGFFKFKKGRIKKLSNPSEDSDTSVLSDFIVYTPSENVSDDNDDNLIFNIPVFRETEYNFVDSYFSLSIGKPTIPLRGVKDTGFFIPLAGNELRRLIESKAEDLLTKSEVVKNYVKGSEFLYITPESYSKKQFEIKWDETKERPSSEKIITGTTRIVWDFGDEDISKQIEEDSLLDLEKDEPLQNEEEGHLDWNFGVQEEDTNTPVEFEKSIDLYPEHEQPKDDRPEQIELPAVEENIAGVPEKEEPEAEKPEIKPDNNENVSWDFGEQEEIKSDNISDAPDLYEKYVEPEPNDEGFIQVPNKRKTFEVEYPLPENSQPDSMINEDTVDELNGENNKANDLYGENTLVVEKELRTGPVTEQKEFYSGKKTTPIFIIALIVIVIVAFALYFFLKNGMLLKKDNSNVNSGSDSEKTPAQVIERKYDIPVTYPYPPENNSVTENGTQADVEQSEIKNEGQEESKAVPKAEEKTIAAKIQTVKSGAADRNNAVKVPGKNLKKVKENIYRDGNNYVVQTSAWKSKIKAQGEVTKLRNKGYAAFVEEVQIPGRGTWYRVRIGNIKSLPEAEKFLQ